MCSTLVSLWSFWLQGNIEMTISQGRIVYQDGKLNVQKGAGRFIPLPTFGPLFRDIDKLDQKLKDSYNAPVNREEG